MQKLRGNAQHPLTSRLESSQRSQISSTDLLFDALRINFGLIQDGWSEGDEHYLSIFANFTEEIEVKQSKEMKYQVRELLLAFSVIEDIV